MSLHRIYHPPTVFSKSDKQELARRITELYTTMGLPAFYVNVIFVPIEEGSLFVGGQEKPTFIRIVIEHLSAQLHSDGVKTTFIDNYEKAIAPFTKERSLEWQIHVQEISNKTWHLNGHQPAAPNSSTEQDWTHYKRIT